jgi:Dolichyl-phosphate-mannose-protein mannosyltransferase
MWFGRWFDCHPKRILGLVLGFGFLLRLRAAWGTFLNPDEALHFLAGNGSSLQAAYQASLDTAHPPLLFLVLHLWRNLGTSALVLRLPSVIAGSVFCWVLFHWLSRILGRAPGWIGLLLATFLPPMIELSAEIRQYALLLCFLMIATYLFERALSADSGSLMVLSFFFLYLALLSHFSGILLASAIGSYGLLRLTSHRFSGRVIAAWVAGQAGALGLFIFLYRTHISQLQGSGSEQRAMDQVFPNSYFHWGHSHWLLFIFARTFGVCQFVFGQLAVGDLAGLAFLAGVAILLQTKSSTEPGRPTLRQLGIFFLLPFAINCGAAMVDLYPYGGTRHSSFLAPFVIAGVSFMLARLTGAQISRGVASALVIVASCQLFGVPHRPYMLRNDQSTANLANAMASIGREVSPSDRIFVDFQTYFLIRSYLCPEIATSFDASVPGFRSFSCGKYEVISTEPDTNIFAAASFLLRWNQMVSAYHLQPGQAVWVFEAGWDIGLDRELKQGFREFRDLEVQSFGRNLRLFRLTVGQPMPATQPPSGQAPRLAPLVAGVQTEGVDGEIIRHGMAIDSIHHAETAVVIPHRPAHAVLFESGTHIADPGGAILRIRESAVHAKLIADQRHIVPPGPLCGLADFSVDTDGIPMVGTVADHVETVHGIRHAGGGLRGRLGGRGIPQTLHPLPVVGPPAGALVSEDVRFVKVEIVDDIGIAQGFEEHQIVIVRPARPRRDDGVGRGSLTNRSHQLRLHSIPAIAVRHFRFVENFEKDVIRVPGRVVCG